MRPLFEIGADLEALEPLLTDIDGEITDDQAGAAIEKWFDDLGAERARRLGRLQRANANGADRLKDRLKQFFEDHNIQKLDLQTFRPRLQTSGGVRALVFP